MWGTKIKLIRKIVNGHGLQEIREFLSDNYIDGDAFTLEMLWGWADEAENSFIKCGIAQIELKAHQSTQR